MFSKLYFKILFGLMVLMAIGSLAYHYFYSNPKKIEKLEKKVVRVEKNKETAVKNAVIETEVKQVNKEIKELQDEEKNITDDSIFRADELNGMFLFNPPRKD